VSTPRAPGPKAAVRAEAQRGRILDAAQKCFIDQGFHAAAMASIAATAGMSAGLIYRYFESKDAIVLAIIERELESKRARIAQLGASADLTDAFVQVFRQWQARDPRVMSAALLLEMSAEAARVPRIAAALRRSDDLGRADFLEWLQRSPGSGGLGLPSALAPSRAIMLQCLFEGLAVRATRAPDLDPETLREALRPLIDHLLSPVPAAQGATRP
jgi:AcrR family transcriptional regulator